MASLRTVSQGIIDKVLYYVDWEGVGAPSPITIAHKEEGPLQFWLDDIETSSAYPFVCVNMQSWPSFRNFTIKQVIAVFTVNIELLDKAAVGENPFQLVRQGSCDILDNILYTGNLNLDYVNNITPVAIQTPSNEMAAYLAEIGRGLAAARITLDIDVVYNPYD